MAIGSDDLLLALVLLALAAGAVIVWYVMRLHSPPAGAGGWLELDRSLSVNEGKEIISAPDMIINSFGMGVRLGAAVAARVSERCARRAKNCHIGCD